ncbi:MAG: HupE/UreJ family protein [Candidatus Thiodiazotropha sp.]
MKQKNYRKFIPALLLLVSAPVAAHQGLHDSGFASGLAHPFSGNDHLLAMLLVGVWSAGFGRGLRTLLVPLAFVACMGLGALFGLAGYGVPMMETGIAFSVIFLGAMLMFGLRLPLGIAALAVGVFALYHGNAHGLEMPSGQYLHYFGGFILATLSLHLLGMGLGRVLLSHDRVLRGLGVLSSLAGASLMFGGVA